MYSRNVRKLVCKHATDRRYESPKTYGIKLVKTGGEAVMTQSIGAQLG